MSAWDPIEYNDGYPVDEEFGAFAGHALNISRAGQWLLAELPRAAEHMCCACDIEDGIGRVIRTPLKRIYFSTMGWSGAEAIMSLVERRADMTYYMESWRRGGHYVFEVPANV